jgi:SAM-dependent MidA family methyltransferase
MSEHPPLDQAFRGAFLNAADDSGAMRFDQFMALALYDEEFGYYRRNHPRIGFETGTDFFTSTSANPVFGELVVAACLDLLGARPPGEYSFVEIGAETKAGVLDGVSHPFASARTHRLGQHLELTGRCIVFSNELFDAQPFRRFVARSGGWKEYYVQVRHDSLELVERLTSPTSQLPSEWPHGYIIDAPFESVTLAERIAAQPWTGLFVACDYGKSWRELISACPEGTARSYHRHRQSNDLLANPGEQDLTCHICWDWIATTLRAHGFAEPELQSQEAFFIRHAARSIEAMIAADAAKFSRRKASLLQLLHPTHQGQKFQVLHAVRD